MLSDPLNETRREFVSALIPSMLSTPATERAHITIRHVSERHEERNHPWWWHNTKIRCLFARAQYLLVWVERQIYFVMFSLVENGAKDNTKVNPLQALCVFKVTHSISRIRQNSFYFFRMDRENKLRERKTIKKETKIEHGKSSGVWKTTHSGLPPIKSCTPLSQRFPPGSDHARRENWIFRLSKPHKPVAGVSGTFLVAFFVQKWTLILLSNLTFHSTCKKGPECVVWETTSGGTGLLMPITIVQVGVKRSMIKTHKKESLAYTEAKAALSKWRVGLALSKIHKMETNDCSFCTHGLGDSRTFRNAEKQ